jgi:hypothetical protein
VTDRFVLIDVCGDMIVNADLPDWFGRAACASDGQLLEDFFVEESHKQHTEKTLGAKRLCASCPVRSECLDWAFFCERNQMMRNGVFGGLSPTERILASQAEDPVAFGLGVLDKQVTLGQVTSPVAERWGGTDAASVGPE